MSDTELVDRVPADSQAWFQTPHLLEMQRRLMVAIRAAGDCAATQTEEVINLTRAVRVLTWALVGFAALQTALMLFHR